MRESRRSRSQHSWKSGVQMEGKSHPANAAARSENVLESCSHGRRAGGLEAVSQGSQPGEGHKAPGAVVGTEGRGCDRGLTSRSCCKGQQVDTAGTLESRELIPHRMGREAAEVGVWGAGSGLRGLCSSPTPPWLSGPERVADLLCTSLPYLHSGGNNSV